KRRSRYSKKGTINLLTGIAKCGHCDAGMTGTTGKKRKDGTRMRYYACYTRRGPEHMKTQDSCDKKYEQKEVIEDKIIKEIMKLKLSDIDKNNGSDDNRIVNLKDELKKTENQISKMVDLFSLGNIPIEVLKD